jgi:hypothetical protein
MSKSTLVRQLESTMARRTLLFNHSIADTIVSTIHSTVQMPTTDLPYLNVQTLTDTSDMFVRHNLSVNGNSKLGSIHIGIPRFASDILRYKYFVITKHIDFCLPLALASESVSDRIAGACDRDHCVPLCTECPKTTCDGAPLDYEIASANFDCNDDVVSLDGYDIYICNNTSCHIKVNCNEICAGRSSHFVYSSAINEWLLLN